MLDGIIYLWVSLTLLSVIYAAYDLMKVTPEVPVMKLAWILVILYTGPIGLFFYLISCKEPMKGTHEEFIKPLWKQALGSKVHCLAGDATGIITAAAFISYFDIHTALEITIEYTAGFLFGLFIFQALFMKNMMGGSYLKALIQSIFPEWLSMNMIMAGMIPTMVIWQTLDSYALSPVSFHFWAKMSLASIIGGILAYPINYWLVKVKLKHGMTTVRKDVKMSKPEKHHHHEMISPSKSTRFFMAFLTLLALALGCFIAYLFQK